MVSSIGTLFAFILGIERYRRFGKVGSRAMATYLNPDSDIMPCMACGHDISGLLFQSMTSDVACGCGAPIVIGRAMFDDTHERSIESRF